MAGPMKNRVTEARVCRTCATPFLVVVPFQTLPTFKHSRHSNTPDLT